MAFVAMSVSRCFWLKNARRISRRLQRLHQRLCIRRAVGLPLDRGPLFRQGNNRRTHARHFLQSFARMTRTVLASHSADLQFYAAGRCLRRTGLWLGGRWHSIAVSFLLAQYSLTDQQSTIIESRF